MKERIESEAPVKLPEHRDRAWRFRGSKQGDGLVVDALLREKGFADVREHAEYKKFQSAEIVGPFYSKLDERSTDGSLPHGDACYIRTWKVILIQPELIHEDEHGLTPRAFTILAHEMGHELAHEKGLAKSPNARDFDADEDELLAWRLALKKYGANKKFDRRHAEEYIKRHTQNRAQRKNPI
jgi:hypothetical protein